MRSIAATEAGCSISNVMLQQQQELLLRHLIAVLAGLGLRQNQRRHRATAPRSARSPAVQAQGVGFNVKTPLIQPVLTRLSRAVDMC